MILTPMLGLRPIVSCLTAARNIRPSVKLSRDKFQVSIDVRSFTQDELRVKARPEYVIIEGKQERKLKNGLMLRQFYRKFKLPDGCDPSNMKSVLSLDGVLTITAPRTVCEMSLPCETSIPICALSEKPNEPNFVNACESTQCDCKNKLNTNNPNANPDGSKKN